MRRQRARRLLRLVLVPDDGAVPGDADAGGQQRGGRCLARPRAVHGRRRGAVHRDDAAQGQRDEHVRGPQRRRRGHGGHRAHGLSAEAPRSP